MPDKKELNKRIIVTGGGSGGHISAASSVIKSITSKYHISKENFLYIGGDLGMVGEDKGNSLEMRLFKEETFPRAYIRAGKLQRSFDLESLKLLLRTFLGFIDSYKIIKTFKPDILISTGGFVSVPVCIVGKLFKAKIYLHEQTASVGLANKIISSISDQIFVTYPSSERYFPKEKVVHTGNLVRDEIFEKNARGQLKDTLAEMVSKQEQYPLVYISGGGLGSHVLNTTVQEHMKYLVEHFQILIQTGDNQVFNDYEKLLLERKRLDTDQQSRVEIVKYVGNEDIGYLLNNIDVFVGRSGANTVYEMGILKIPSIFIPIPWVTNHEQEENAEILVNTGLAKIIREGELTGEKLLMELKHMKGEEREIDYKALKEIFILDANKKILKAIGI